MLLGVFWGLFRADFLVVLAEGFFSTAVGVEASAGAGAWFFLIGTLLWVDESPDFDGEGVGAHGGGFSPDTILQVWMVGSFAFMLGSLFLGYRHFVLGL